MSELELNAELGLPVPRGSRLRAIQKFVSRILWSRLRYQVAFNRAATAEIHSLQKRLDEVEFQVRRHDGDLDHHSSVLVRHEAPLARFAVLEAAMPSREDINARLDLAQRQNFARIHDAVGEMRREVADINREFLLLPRDLKESEVRSEERLNGLVDSVINSVVDSTGKELAEIRSGLASERQLIDRIISEHQRRLAKIERAILSNGSTSAQPETVRTSGLETQSLYASLKDDIEEALEPNFWQVMSRQRPYLELLRENGDSIDLALDLKCGRGEWLTLLGEIDIAAYGIDPSVEHVSLCIARGLDARREDALSHLRQVKPSTLGLITALGMIEYLNIDDILDVIDLSLNALQPGGVLLLDSTNPESLSAFAALTAQHPDAVRPISRLLMEVLLATRGFVDVTSLAQQESHPSIPPSSEIAPWSQDLQSLFDVVRGPLLSPDRYAIMARRPF